MAWLENSLAVQQHFLSLKFFQREIYDDVKDIHSVVQRTTCLFQIMANRSESPVTSGSPSDLPFTSPFEDQPSRVPCLRTFNSGLDQFLGDRPFPMGSLTGSIARFNEPLLYYRSSSCCARRSWSGVFVVPCSILDGGQRFAVKLVPASPNGVCIFAPWFNYPPPWKDWKDQPSIWTRRDPSMGSACDKWPMPRETTP